MVGSNRLEGVDIGQSNQVGIFFKMIELSLNSQCHKRRNRQIY